MVNALKFRDNKPESIHIEKLIYFDSLWPIENVCMIQLILDDSFLGFSVRFLELFAKW